MNQLQRIILINSANIAYREIQLDGNIHFIGTQGTGKSTLLRAILFFYNADSRKLGISKEKKPFADFYFPYADSYIFYEVKQGPRTFCMWLYRKQNRLCFRFIDGGFSKELVLEGNRARNEAEVIARAGKSGFRVERSIFNFSEYRDILYGANKSMKRYSLLNNKTYQNIPRTISNIFLNSSLDGGFIKQTIINSLSDEVFEINLDVNRHHLEKARGDFADVNEYLKHEKKAQNIVADYQELLNQEQQRKELAWQIGGAYNYAREQQLITRENLETVRQSIQEQEQKIKKITSDHQNKQRIIQDKLSNVVRDIKKANQLQKAYEAKNIGQVIEENKRKPVYDQQVSQLREQIRLMTSQQEQLEQQYQIARQKLQNETICQINELKNQLTTIKEKNLPHQSQLEKDYWGERAVLQKEYNEKKEVYLAEHKDLEKEIFRIELEIKSLQQKEFFKAEIESLEQKKQELHAAAIKRKAEQRQLAELKRSQVKDGETAQKLLNIKTGHQIEIISREKETTSQKIITLKKELAALQGSLLEFLENQCPYWGTHIGKVIRRDLLLRNDLQPQLENGDNLFGLKLQLQEVESIHLSKKELELQLADAQSFFESQSKALKQYQEEIRDKKDKITRKYNKLIAETSEKLRQCDYDLQQNEIAAEKIIMVLSRLTEQAETEKQKQLSAMEANEHKIKKQLEQVDELLTQIRQRENKALQELEKQHNQKIKELKKQILTDSDSFDRQISDLKSNLQQQLNELEAQRNKALQEKGVDTGKLQELENESKALSEKLEAIADNYKILIEYEKDCKEYIHQLDEFRKQRKAYEEDIEHKEQLFHNRMTGETEWLEKHKTIYAEHKRISDHLERQIQNMQRFSKESLYEELKSYLEHHDKFSEIPCEELIDKLKNLSLDYEKKDKSLTERITEFSGYFNDDNCLGFNVHINGHLATRQFTRNLKEFVREQKIIEFKTEVTRKYAMVLDTIIKETNDLLLKEDEIQKIIQRINADFRKSNFVGVVKNIEMRLQPSSNKVIQVLRQIREFQKEKSMSFGELNLFNQGGSDKNDREAVDLLENLQKQIVNHKNNRLHLEDAFELEFRIQENENDTNWVNRLANVGSNGTDVLVKSMIYINLLNIFKSNGGKSPNDAVLHCLIDEVGILHDSNVTGLITFAGERNIRLINGSPNSHNEQDYKHIYIFRKDKSTNKTGITKLISNEL